MKTKIHFIVNPIAGSGKNNLSIDTISRLFESTNFEIVIKESLFSKHAIDLANESIIEKATVIVACGGDGTINEVASCLVNTGVIFGIIPMGSGNGLASNLKIPRRIENALKIIHDANVIEIDAGLINNQFFFSNTGIGFDAHVIYDFEKSTKRKFWGYVNAVKKSIRNYTYQEVELSYLNQTIKISPFLLFISNSNEMGYKMSLTPKASLQDGLLDIIIVPKLSTFKMICFTMLFFIKRHYWLGGVKIDKAESLAIKNTGTSPLKIQKDGESLGISVNLIEIKVLPNALKICVP